MHQVLELLWGQDWETALQSFIREDKQARAAVQNIPRVEVSVINLLKVKDRNCIPDHLWPQFIKDLQLAKGGSLHYVRQVRREINDKMPIEASEDGSGYHFDLKQYLRWLLERDPPKDPIFSDTTEDQVRYSNS